MKRKGITSRSAHSTLAAVLLAVGSFVSGTLFAELPALDRSLLLGETDGFRLYAVGPQERKLANALLDLTRTGDGGGGDVANAIAIETDYDIPEDGNVVLLLWDESTANPSGVEVFVNDNSIGIANGLPPEELPGGNALFITGFPLGDSTIRLEAEGTVAETMIKILDTQPFNDATDVTCKEGARDPATGNCSVDLTWSSTPPDPTFYLVLADGNPIAQISGAERTITIPGVPPGERTMTLLGFLENEDGVYRGGFVEVTCSVVCEDAPCGAPSSLLLCQVTYGAAAANVLRAEWTNGEVPYPVEVLRQVDGLPLGALPGEAQSTSFDQLAAGEHTIGIQGNCGDPDGLSSIATDTFNVLSASPHTTPVEGPILCVFNGDTGEAVLSWTNATASASIDVYVVVGQDLIFIGALEGDTTGVTIGPATGDEVFAFQFFAFFEGDCYGSDLIQSQSKSATKRYLQGMCNGVGEEPQITSAIFSLNFLFIGGTTPPCLKACDTNGDGRFDLSDAVAILAYLFTGGEAPSQWVDQDANGTRDPTCSDATAEDDCETGHEVCA